MTTFIKLNGRLITGVLKTDQVDPGGEYTNVGSWGGYSERPAANMSPVFIDDVVGWLVTPTKLVASSELREANGALYWHDIRTLPEAKIQKWGQMKSARQASIDSPLSTPHGTFDCGPRDRTNLTDAVALLQTLEAEGTPTTVTFTLADNTTAILTTAQLVTVALLLGQKVQTAYAVARVLRTQISDAVSIAAVEAIVWNGA